MTTEISDLQSTFSHFEAPVALISDNDDTHVNTSAALFNISLFLSLPLLPCHSSSFPTIPQSSSEFTSGLQNPMEVPLVNALLHAIITTRHYKNSAALLRGGEKNDQNDLAVNTREKT